MAQANKVNILVVDDLPEKLLVFQTILEELGENLVLARSGAEALRRVLEQDFAVILLDVNMPGLDGFETAELIRRRKRSTLTPIIFITAYSDEISAAHGYSLGAVDYILTPVVPEVLRSKVKVFVDLFRMTEQVRRQAEERVALAREQAARAAAEETSRRLAFLSEASRTLSGSLEPDTIARSLAQLAVPFLADLAGVTLAGEGGLPWHGEFAWVWYPDPQLHTCRLCGLDAPRGELWDLIERALISGKSENLDALDVPSLTTSNEPPPAEQRLQSVLILPLSARGRTLGVLTLAHGASGRRYEGEDVALAQELASRAAIALDNARLHQNIQEGDRRKDEFLSMLAHELRNPLAPIRNAVAVYQKVPLSDPVLLRARDIIDRQVAHMSRLIDDLLDVSRLTRGKILLRKEAVNLTELVRTTVEDYRSTLEDARLRLELRLPEQSLPTWGDPTRLAQVLGNVLHNASKFTDPGGTVFVELRTESEQDAVVTIHDTGIGMDRIMLGRVFEMFSQADRSLDRGKGGLGLGLALVKGLIELHGGEVRISSAGPGCGTEVQLRLPLEEVDAVPGPLPPPQASGSSLQVLVVEDNRDAADSLRLLLSLLGHEVRVSYSGEEGLETARTFQPEVILCDIGLPGKLDGYRFAREVRKDPLLASSFLIAITGYGQTEDRQRSQEAGFDLHLTKPVEFHQLQHLLASFTTLGRK